MCNRFCFIALVGASLALAQGARCLAQRDNRDSSRFLEQTLALRNDGAARIPEGPVLRPAYKLQPAANSIQMAQYYPHPGRYYHPRPQVEMNGYGAPQRIIFKHLNDPWQHNYQPRVIGPLHPWP